jgi:hypothetical protein
VSTPADRIAAAKQKAAATIAANLFPGRYEVLRTTKTRDELGGRTETPAVVETGRCELKAPQLRAVDRAGAIGTAVGPYVARLWPDINPASPNAPRFSNVLATDELRVTVANRGNEVRTFTIVGQPTKGDDMAMFVTVQLELKR